MVHMQLVASRATDTDSYLLKSYDCLIMARMDVNAMLVMSDILNRIMDGRHSCSDHGK